MNKALIVPKGLSTEQALNYIENTIEFGNLKESEKDIFNYHDFCNQSDDEEEIVSGFPDMENNCYGTGNESNLNNGFFEIKNHDNETSNTIKNDLSKFIIEDYCDKSIKKELKNECPKEEPKENFFIGAFSKFYKNFI